MLMQTRIGKRGRTNKYDSIKGLTADFTGNHLLPSWAHAIKKKNSHIYHHT